MDIPWYKYWLSYFYLVTVKRLDSNINPGLCLQMEAGRLLLNTTNANYSYGNLHKVFEDVFEIIDLEKTPPFTMLLLGLGTGSVIDILQRQYGFDPKITAVEIDPSVIHALEYWPKLNLTNTEIICGDAFDIINTLQNPFDLIIVDLFIDLDANEKIWDTSFLKKLKSLLAIKGKVLVNYVVNNEQQKNHFQELQIQLMTVFGEIKVHELMGMNRVLELNVS